jgi:hypothetical protein
MPYTDPDPTDPHLLVGVLLPAEADSLRKMVYAFAEEFARMGYDEARLLRVFRNPFYAGAHQAYRALGEEAVREIVRECVQVWSQGRTITRAGA